VANAASVAVEVVAMVVVVETVLIVVVVVVVVVVVFVVVVVVVVEVVVVVVLTAQSWSAVIFIRAFRALPASGTVCNSHTEVSGDGYLRYLTHPEQRGSLSHLVLAQDSSQVVVAHVPYWSASLQVPD